MSRSRAVACGCNRKNLTEKRARRYNGIAPISDIGEEMDMKLS